MTDLRAVVPQALGALIRRYGDFAGAEDAVQEALLVATATWPERGEPDDPLAWLVRVASRRLLNQYRADSARRRREELAGSWSAHEPPAPAPGEDETLALILLCCHPALSAGAAIPLTLRAVGGLTTKEIAAAFLVPETTLAQRISRAKAKLRELDAPFRMPHVDLGNRTRWARHVLYVMFSEGHAATAGPELGRVDLAREAIRLTRLLLTSLPEPMLDDGEVHGLLGLMLLSEARRPARTTADGALVPLAGQDRSRWDRDLIAEGLAHATASLEHGPPGEYGLQAAINALHIEAPSYGATRWADVATLYERLERLTGNPVVRLNRAVAVAMVEGPATGLALIADLDDRLADHHRLASVRAHLYEQHGDCETATRWFRLAAERATNQRERDYLLIQAARVSTRDDSSQ